MLSQNDLIQIKTVVENVFDDKFKKELKPINNRFDKTDERFDKIDKKLIEHDTKFDKIDARFDQVDERFKQIDIKFDKINSKFKKVDKQLKKIQKDLTITIKYFDSNCLVHKKHLDRIEQHLGLPQFPIV